MLNDIQRWHRTTIRKIAAAFGLPDDLSHHHWAHVRHRHVNHHRNQRVAGWHARHAAEVMAGTSRLYRWERLVYKIVSRMIKLAK